MRRLEEWLHGRWHGSGTMIHTTVDVDRGLAINRGSGDFVVADLLSALSNVERHPDFQPGFKLIWDLRDTEMGISLMEIVALDPEIVALANRLCPGGKTAWVAPSAFAESVIRILYRSHPWAAEWRTFTTLESACAWFGP